MKPPPPDKEISGKITNIAETIGGRDFVFDDFSKIIITLTPLVQKADTYRIAGNAAGTVAITGNTYTISGVSAGTYRLTAEDPTGLYDFVDNHVVITEKTATRDIALAVFKGLKMTVRIPASSSAFILPVKQNLGNSPMLQDPGVVVDLAVDWGDGGEPVHLDKKPNGYEDPAFTHSYAAPRDYTIRITGKCWGTEPNGRRDYDDKGKFGMSFTRNGEGTGHQAGHSGPITLPVGGFALDENKDKLIRLAGNITALTKPDAKNGYAYCYTFDACNKLEDISGLAFTDTGASGEYFMRGIFQNCAALTTMPTDFVPRGLLIEEKFLDSGFLNNKKLEAIGPRFLPDNLSAVGGTFLSNTFSGCTKLAEVPVGFLPQSLTATSDGFLYGMFSSSGIAAIPGGFIPASVYTAGTSFLANTFSGCGKLKTIPADFLPASLVSAGDFFLSGAFSSSGVTAVPENFLPANLATIGSYFLSNTFSGCATLATADITVPASLAAVPSGFMQRTFYNCSKLNMVDLFANGAAPAGSDMFMAEIFTGVAVVKSPKLTLRIHTADVLNPVTAAAGLLDANITALEVPSALVSGYKSHEKWGGGGGGPVTQSKIIAIQETEG
jgi:hypothetical protein